MRIYNKPTRKKRTTSCSYCGGLGHLWTTCVYPRQHIDQVNRGEQMDLTVFQGIQAKRAFKTNKETGLPEPRTEWLIQNAREFFEKQVNKSIKHHKKTKKAPVRRCGFCNSPSHNRKNCKLMKSFISDLTEANKHYRKEFFDRLVGHHGIAEGALVEIRLGGRRTSGEMEKQIAIIQEIDWDAINISLDLEDNQYSGEFNISVVSDGETLTGKSPFWYWLDSERGRNLSLGLGPVMKPNVYDDTFQVLEVLSQSDNKPSAKWFNEGYDNAWEWVCKNRSLLEIGSVFADVIEKWCPILKAKRGLEARLRRYRKK